MKLRQFTCLRGPSYALLVCAMASAATGQVQRNSLRPITSQVKDAGTYHMATGTWTRNTAGTALIGPSALYDNTCSLGYYTGLPAGTILADSGRIPSTSDGGLYDGYEIECFQIAYCSFAPVVTSIGVSWYDCYAACDGFLAQTPVQAFALINMPAGTISNGQGCWVITFNLTNTTFVWNLGGDCNGNYDNVPSTDSFGWTWTELTPPVSSNGGPILAGDPSGFFNGSGCAIGDGTDHPGPGSWGGPGVPGTNGSGIGVLDQFELDGTGGLTGCFWFGGYSPQNPMAAFHHELSGREGGSIVLNQGSSYCDGSSGNCPGGVSGAAGHGCPNSNPDGLGALLDDTGSAEFSNDTYGFQVTSGAPSKPGIMIQGASAISYPSGNSGVPGSAGLFCVAPQQRGKVSFTDGVGSVTIDEFQAGVPFGAGAQPVGNTTYYQFWQRDPNNANANGGAGSGNFNFSNAIETVWI